MALPAGAIGGTQKNGPECWAFACNLCKGKADPQILCFAEQPGRHRFLIYHFRYPSAKYSLTVLTPHLVWIGANGFVKELSMARLLSGEISLALQHNFLNKKSYPNGQL